MNQVTRILFCSIAATFLLSCASVCLAKPLEEPSPAEREIKIIARRFEFQPKSISVRKGERVKLIVTSADVDHGVAIEAFGIDQPVKAKETRVIEFTPDREGKFAFTCSVFCGDRHPDMAGELIVTGEQTPAASNLKV